MTFEVALFELRGTDTCEKPWYSYSYSYSVPAVLVLDECVSSTSTISLSTSTIESQIVQLQKASARILDRKVLADASGHHSLGQFVPRSLACQSMVREQVCAIIWVELSRLAEAIRSNEQGTLPWENVFTDLIPT